MMAGADWRWRARRGRGCSGGHGSCRGSQAGGPLWSPRRRAFWDTNVKWWRWRLMTDGEWGVDNAGITWLPSKRLHHSPGGGQDGGVESPKAGKSHGQWNSPVHHAKHLVCKSLQRKDSVVQNQIKKKQVAQFTDGHRNLPQLQHHCPRWHSWGGWCSKPRWSEYKSRSLWAWKWRWPGAGSCSSHKQTAEGSRRDQTQILSLKCRISLSRVKRLIDPVSVGRMWIGLRCGCLLLNLPGNYGRGSWSNHMCSLDSFV